MMKMTKNVACGLLLAACLPLAATADIVTPKSAVATSNFFAPAENLINGSGLIDNGMSVVDRLHNNVETDGWLSNSNVLPPDQFVDFTLRGRHDLTDMYVWQHNGLDGGGMANLNRGVMEFEVFVSEGLDPAPFVSAGTFVLNAATDPVGGAGEATQAFSLNAANVRRVQFDINSTIGPSDFVGLSEVRFGGQLVPEPAGIVLLIAGMFAIAGLRRRTR